MDVYHLWVFPKGYALPFVIHPTKEKMQCSKQRVSQRCFKTCGE